MAINFLGVGSGLQLQTMLDQLVEVATTPKVEQLGKKEAQINGSISGLGSIKSALSSFQDSVDKLNSSSLFGNNSATLTQPESGDVISVTADSDAVKGSYDVSVLQLAKGSMLVSDADLSSFSASGLGGGTANLTFAAGASNFSVAVDDGDDLTAIVNKINAAEDNFGVTATIVDGSLVYKSSTTGAANTLSVSNDDAGLDSLSTVATSGPAGFTNSKSLDISAQNAQIKVDGITIDSTTNEFDGSVSGLKITALAVSQGSETANVSIDKNTGSIESAINELASSYNAVIAALDKQYGSEDKEGNFVPGPMYGESIIRQVQGLLSDSMSSVFNTGNSALNSMASLGLELQDDGTISVDSDMLSESVSTNFDDISSLFVGDSGYAGKMSSMLDAYLDYDGVIDSSETNYKSQLDDIETQYEKHIEYIKSYRETLMKQFSSLDSTIATLNATRDYMMSQLSQLSKIGS